MYKHLENKYKIDPFLRYIMNNTDNNIPINEGFKIIKRNANDWINQHELYIENFLYISNYITSLFTSNGNKTLEEYYDRTKINSSQCDKGIHLDAWENNSMEEHIIDLFWNETSITNSTKCIN